MKCITVLLWRKQPIPVNQDLKGVTAGSLLFRNSYAGFRQKSLPVPVEPGNNRFRRLCAGQLLDDFSISQQHDDRDAAYAETGCQCRILLGIYLHHCRFAGKSFSNCSHRRCERDAVWSPWGPEFSQHRSLVVGDESVQTVPG